MEANPQDSSPPITWDVERFCSVAVRESIPSFPQWENHIMWENPHFQDLIMGVDVGRSVVLPIDPGDIDPWLPPGQLDINGCSLEEWAKQVDALVRDVYAGRERESSQRGADGLCD